MEEEELDEIDVLLVCPACTFQLVYRQLRHRCLYSAAKRVTEIKSRKVQVVTELAEMQERPTTTFSKASRLEMQSAPTY